VTIRLLEMVVTRRATWNNPYVTGGSVWPVHLVELPSGCRIELPLERMLAFCRAEHAYYDAIPSRHPDRIDPVDVLATVAMNSRVDTATKVRQVHQGMASRCERTLASIPQDADLLDFEKWKEPLRRLLHEAVQTPGVLIAVATKVLHRKRRFLIPMLDSVVLKHYLASNRGALNACFESKNKAADGAIEALVGFHDDLSRTKREIDSVRQSLSLAGYPLSPVRILEVLLWTQIEPGHYYRPAAVSTGPHESAGTNAARGGTRERGHPLRARTSARKPEAEP
jgi:hypothetical protein